jgi:hypothetical protein
MRLYFLVIATVAALPLTSVSAFAQQDSVLAVTRTGESLLRVNVDGNVGIGISQPTQKLQVVGGVLADSANLGLLRFGDSTRIITAKVALLEPAFVSGWSHGSGMWPSAGYAKDNSGFVRLDGSVVKTAGGNAIMTLPEGYRPRGFMVFPVYNSNSYPTPGWIIIEVSGLVTFQQTTAAPGTVMLTGISFLAQ